MATELPLDLSTPISASAGADRGGCACEGNRARSTGRGIARMVRVIERAVGEVDLTLSQYRVLALLDEGCDVASRIAEQLVVSKPSISGVIDGLVGRELVARRPGDHDRRRVDLELTPAGFAALAAADAAIEQQLDRIEELIAELRA